MPWDPRKVAEDLKWLQDHPWFVEKPASIREFLGEDYLNIDEGMREGVRDELITLFGETVSGERIAVYRWAMISGAIGIGKTTIASVVLPYMVHWTLCLRNPQKFFDLLPGSRIAFMMMSTSEKQAKETLFGDVKARINHSPWFKNNFPPDPDLKNQLRFDKDVWILPGSSAETSFEGYNILGGILDEADSHRVTVNKDYAEDGWATINGRIDSRFQDRGFLLTIGQMKKSSGFAARKFKELSVDPDAHTCLMTIWDSLGWEKFSDSDGNRISFWYDKKRKEIVPVEAVQLLGYPDHLIEIPKVYEMNFRNKPEQALRDLAGIPPTSGSSFISLTHKIEECFERWEGRFGRDTFVSSDPTHPILDPEFRAPDPLRRAIHIDIAYSGDGDAAAIAMGHVSHLAIPEDSEDDDEKPFITIDCIIRIKAPQGREILISDIRKYVYDLKARGFRLGGVSLDGFQSQDTIQQFRKKRIKTRYLSVDKSKLPYEDLREAIYESRIDIPPYMTYMYPGDEKLVNVAFRELTQLEDTGRKIDHPAKGSKDVADALAGVVTTCMGDRSYRKRVYSADNDAPKTLNPDDPFGFKAAGLENVQRGFGDSGIKAPVPPTLATPNFPIPAGR